MWQHYYNSTQRKQLFRTAAHDGKLKVWERLQDSGWEQLDTMLGKGAVAGAALNGHLESRGSEIPLNALQSAGRIYMSQCCQRRSP